MVLLLLNMWNIGRRNQDNRTTNPGSGGAPLIHFLKRFEAIQPPNEDNAIGDGKNNFKGTGELRYNDIRFNDISRYNNIFSASKRFHST